MFEKNGNKFYEYKDAKDISEGYYHLYHLENFDNVYIPNNFIYDGIIEYKKYDNEYELLTTGHEIVTQWIEEYYIDNRGIQKNYLVGPILPPIEKEDLIDYV
jgi:hypothetical protein